MSRVRTTKQRSTREKASDRRRLYEVPERALIEPQGKKGRIRVSDGDESDMQDGYVVYRKARILADENFADDVMPDTTDRYFSGDVADNWAERYDAEGVVSQVSGHGEMNIFLGDDNPWGVYYVSSKLALQKDIEVAARLKHGSFDVDALLGVRLGGEVSSSTNLQDGIFIAVGDRTGVYLVKDGVESHLHTFSSKPPTDSWFWVTLAVKGGWVWASMGDTNEEAPLRDREPIASQTSVLRAGHTGVGITGLALNSVDVDHFIARTPTI